MHKVMDGVLRDLADVQEAVQEPADVLTKQTSQLKHHLTAYRALSHLTTMQGVIRQIREVVFDDPLWPSYTQRLLLDGEMMFQHVLVPKSPPRCW